MNTLEHHEPPRTRDLRPIAHRTQATLRKPGGAAMRWLWDIHTHGEHRVPSRGRALLACNHVGWLDGPLMVGLAPRPVHALVKHEMFAGQLGLLLHAVGQIPVERATIDVRAIRLAIRALRDDRVVTIYPEGTRGDGELRKMKRGLAYLALVTGAPVVPVALLGTRVRGESVSRIPPRGRRIDIVYGEPIAVNATSWPRTRESVEQLTRSLQRELVANLEHALDISGQQLPGPAADEEAKEADMVGLADDSQEDS